MINFFSELRTTKRPEISTLFGEADETDLFGGERGGGFEGFWGSHGFQKEWRWGSVSLTENLLTMRPIRIPWGGGKG